MLRLMRHTFSPERTLGSLVDDVLGLLAFTLEDADRLTLGFSKIAKRTAIPAGLYRIRITYSWRFGRKLPLLMDVAGFEGIRIHAGNTEADTEGCILVGQSLNMRSLAAGSSRPALAAVQSVISELEKEAKGAWVEIIDLLTDDFVHLGKDRLRAAWGRDVET